MESFRIIRLKPFSSLKKVSFNLTGSNMLKTWPIHSKISQALQIQPPLASRTIGNLRKSWVQPSELGANWWKFVDTALERKFPISRRGLQACVKGLGTSSTQPGRQETSLGRGNVFSSQESSEKNQGLLSSKQSCDIRENADCTLRVVKWKIFESIIKAFKIYFIFPAGYFLIYLSVFNKQKFS